MHRLAPLYYVIHCTVETILNGTVVCMIIGRFVADEVLMEHVISTSLDIHQAGISRNGSGGVVWDCTETMIWIFGWGHHEY